MKNEKEERFVTFDMFWTVHAQKKLMLPEDVNPCDKAAVSSFIEESIHSMELPTPDANERGTEYFNEESVEVSGEISRGMIREGIRKGIVLFEKDPHSEGTVCRIGEYWFYFGELAAAEKAPEDYVKDIPESDIVEEIYIALKEYKEIDETEHAYYFWFLLENLQKREAAQAEVK